MTVNNKNDFLALKEILLREHLENFQNLSTKVGEIEHNFDDKQYVKNQLTPVIDTLIEENIKEKIVIQEYLHTLVEKKIQEDIIGNKETFTHMFEPFISESLTKYFKRHFLALLHHKTFLAILLGLLLLFFIYLGVSVYQYFSAKPFETFQTQLVEKINAQKELEVYDLAIKEDKNIYVIEGKVRTKSQMSKVVKIAKEIDSKVPIANKLRLLTPVISHKETQKNLSTIMTLFNKLQHTNIALTYTKSIRQLHVSGDMLGAKQKQALIDALKKVKGIKTIVIDFKAKNVTKQRAVKAVTNDISEELKDLVQTAPQHFPKPIKTKNIIKEPTL